MTSRVLLLDRDREQIAVLGLLLARHGHTAVTAHDGDEALRLARAEPPSLVILDHGFVATLRALRTLPGCADLPAIALHDRDAPAPQRGVTPLRRPFEFTALIDLLPATPTDAAR